MAEIFVGRKVVRRSPARIGKKIEILMGEGKPQSQAAAMSMSMEKEHRLTDKGEYIRVRKKKKL